MVRVSNCSYVVLLPRFVVCDDDCEGEDPPDSVLVCADAAPVSHLCICYLWTLCLRSSTDVFLNSKYSGLASELLNRRDWREVMRYYSSLTRSLPRASSRVQTMTGAPQKVSIDVRLSLVL
jgi:hypothetical protein